jgi:hypothetical protein
MVRPHRTKSVRTLFNSACRVGLASACVACVGLAGTLPAFGASDPVARGPRLVLQTAAPWAAGAVLVFAPAALYFGRLRRRRAFHPFGSVDVLRSLSRRDFEAALTESFRLQGYAVEGRAVSASGVGLLLRKPDRKILVQCRYGTDPQVGVEAVQRLHEAMVAEKATGGLIATCAALTPGARAFATDKPIGLIDGRALLELVNRGRPLVAQSGNTMIRNEPYLGLSVTQMQDCPLCGSVMVPAQEGQRGEAPAVLWNCSLRRCAGTLAV